MIRQIIAIRPEPGLGQTIAAGRAIGLDIHGAALSEITACDWDYPTEPASFDGLLVGSANALRHGGPHLKRFTSLPVYAVGKTTAETARAGGFTVTVIGSGGLQQLLDALPSASAKKLHLLRLAGNERVTLTAPVHVRIVERVVYQAAALPIGTDLAKRLTHNALVLLHSAAAAVHFRTECERHSLDRRVIAIAALGPRIVEAAGEGWGKCAFAANPTDAALLALARELCQ